MNKLFEKMKEYHKYIFDMFDLSSSLTLSVTVYKDKAIVTNSNTRLWGEECKKTEVGSKLAETILLNLESYNTDFGSWLSDVTLPYYKNILNYTKEDFELPLELMKFWQILRVICNSNKDEETIYQVEYFLECDAITIFEFKNKNEVNQFFEDYVK